MVGQLLYSLMPWRMPSSSRTLTVFTFFGSTPLAFRIWIARPEKPHIGKLALPFMKRTTSLDLTSSSMRCWVSLMESLLYGVMGYPNFPTLCSRPPNGCDMAGPRGC